MTIQFTYEGATQLSPPNAGRDAGSEILRTEGESVPRRRVWVARLIRYFPHALIGLGAILSVLWTIALFWVGLLFISGLIPR